MSIFSSLTEQVSGFASGVKNKFVQTAVDLKKSTEDFIGDIVIKSAVNRLKEGALNYLSSDKLKADSNIPTETASEGAPSSKKKTCANDSAFGSPGLMQSLMSRMGVEPDEGMEVLADQFNLAFDNVSKDVSSAVSEAVREKINSIKPEDVVKSAGGLLSNAIGNLEAESDDSDTSFKLNSSIQIIGAIIAAIGILMIAYNHQETPQTKVVDEPSLEERQSFSMN